MEKYINSNKLKFFPLKVNGVLQGTLSEPITLEIWLSMACNHKCYYCIAHKVKSPEIMQRQNISKLIKAVKENNIPAVILSGGGEPTVSPYFRETIIELKNNNIDIGIITNGGLIENFVNDILMNCVWCRISFDAVNKEQFQNIRGADDFEKVKLNIKQLIDMKKEIESKTTIGIQMVVNKENFNNIIDFVEMCRNDFPDIDYVQIRPLEAYITEEVYTKEQEEKIKSQLIKINEYADGFSEKIIVSDKWDIVFSSDRRFGFNACWGAELTGVIHSNGNFYLCCHSANNKGYLFGNVFAEDFADVLVKRHEIIGRLKNRGLNAGVCPVACRLSGANTYLESIKKGGKHQNFI